MTAQQFEPIVSLKAAPRFHAIVEHPNNPESEVCVHVFVRGMHVGDLLMPLPSMPGEGELLARRISEKHPDECVCGEAGCEYEHAQCEACAEIDECQNMHQDWDDPDIWLCDDCAKEAEAADEHVDF